jgi:hypothetical protein
MISMVCIYAILFTLAAPGIALAKGSSPLAWDNVLRLRKGAQVSVVLFSKKMYQGKVDEVQPTSLALTTAAGAMMIPKDDINSITTIAKPKAANPGLWAAAGGVLMMGIGGLVNSGKDISNLSNGQLPSNHSHAVEITGAIVAAGGVAVLVLVGKPRLIYQGTQAPASPAK